MHDDRQGRVYLIEIAQHICSNVCLLYWLMSIAERLIWIPNQELSRDTEEQSLVFLT